MNVYDFILKFATEHWFLSFLCICSAYHLLRFFFKGVVVCIRGWPPEYCDSDGDPVQTEDEEEIKDGPN